jgi:hypothetical protein
MVCGRRKTCPSATLSTTKWYLTPYTLVELLLFVHLCMWVYHTYRNTRVGICAVLFGLIPKLDTTAALHRAEHRAVDTITGTAYTSLNFR